MNSWTLFAIIAAYFIILASIARITSRHSRDSTFFDGDRKSPWFLVAFGMIGSGISAVSLVSIPGNVGNENLYYFQFILGTIVGYLFIAFVLLPIFYQLRVVSLYQYLDKRFGKWSYKTGALFFMVSQSFGAALRLLLSVKILQAAFFDKLGIPPAITVAVVLLLIWIYTNQSGVKTIVWTDALQSFLLITVILVSIFTIKNSLGLSFGGMMHSITEHSYAKVFDWDIRSGSNFWKQFIAGFLITVALVGLDQSMMQKTLTIKDAKGARQNVLSFSFFIAAAQTLFLGLGVLMYVYMEQKGIPLLREGGRILNTDAVYPDLTLHYFGSTGAIAFFIAVIASTFASIDSCITALTTSFSYDFMNFEQRSHEERKRIKNGVLLGVNAVMFMIVMATWNSQGAIINTIFRIAGYTYGPLLGLYLTGFFSQIQLKEKWVPLACVSAAVLTWLLGEWLIHQWRFDLGFMNIGVNALLTVVFLYLVKRKKHEHNVRYHH